jgi:lipoprotein-anchoring transpeptidase ErfK/SrfK
MPFWSITGNGKLQIMIIDDGIAGTGEMDEGNRLGLRPGAFSRRSFLLGSAAGLGALALAGCTTSGGSMSLAEAQKVYGPVPSERFPIPAVNLNKINPKYYRQTVRYASKEAAGTIIVDPTNHYVYRIEGDGNATRYGASVGRAGFLWNGDAYIGRKAEWPVWTPPKEMIQRQPEAAKYAGGMAPGLDNPLGARTLYLYQNGAYTLYTLYSTTVAETIGKGISSGCIGLLTQDMIDLYSKTPVKTKVVVLRA